MKPRGLHQLFYRSAVLAVIFSAAALPAYSVTPDFSITSTAVTVVQGATTSNASTITVTPVGGFTGSVALTAAVTSSPANAVVPPTLSFGTTTPVNITGAGAGTATLTISTSAGGPVCSATNAVPPTAPWYTASGAALACILIFGIPARRRSGWRTMLGMLFLLVAFTSGALACAGGQMTTHACPALSTAGTTPGTYTITVTGMSTSTTTTGTVTLTVMASPALDTR